MKRSPIMVLGKPVFMRVPMEVTETFVKDYQRFSKVNLEVGKFIQLDVNEDDLQITKPTVHFETEQQCVIACDNHNRFWGWKVEEKTAVLDNVIDLLEKLNLKAVAMLLLVFFAFTGRAQGCEGKEPQLSITSACNGSVCLKNTYNIGTAFCNWFVVNATGATAYSWTDGVATGTGSAYTYSPSAAGVTTVLFTGSVTYTDGLTCTATASILLEAVVCDFVGTVGIADYEAEAAPAEYFDLLGNRVAPEAGAVLIERRGVKVRKVVIVR